MFFTRTHSAYQLQERRHAVAEREKSEEQTRRVQEALRDTEQKSAEAQAALEELKKKAG